MDTSPEHQKREPFMGTAYGIIAFSIVITFALVIGFFVQQIAHQPPIGAELMIAEEQTGTIREVPVTIWAYAAMSLPLLLIMLIPVAAQIAVMVGLYIRQLALSIGGMMVLALFCFMTGFTIGVFVMVPAAVTLVGLIVGIVQMVKVRAVRKA